ncbi:hypothetical protein QUF55_09215 [Clostridiaceae bacterium HSG29]|nr:hypothetical protein [Clostridiaceae bacterium HSG29]
MTFSATSMSGLLFLGFSGMIYEEGLQNLWMIIPSSMIGVIISYKYISKKVRKYSEYIGAVTVIEILRKRYIDPNHTLIYITGFMTFAATLMYTSGQLIAAGKLIKLVLGFDYNYSIIVFATIIVSYTALGGFTALCWTDVFQGILMVSGSLLAGLAVMKLNNGWEPLWIGMKNVNMINSGFKISPFSNMPSIILGITIFLGDGIMSWIGQPTLMTKYMSAKDQNVLSRGGMLSVLFQVILFSGVLLSSLYMRTKFISPTQLPLSSDIEAIFIQFFISQMSPFLGGIILGGIIAAIMSTADSLLILTSSILVNDIYTIHKPNMSVKHLILLSKMTIMVLGIIIVYVSFNVKSVLDTAWVGWAVLGIIGVPIIVGLYWKNATFKGAIWSQIVGFLTLFMLVVYIAIVVIASTSDLATMYNFLDILLAAVVIPNVIGVILMTKKCREIKKDFFDNEKYCPKKVA